MNSTSEQSGEMGLVIVSNIVTELPEYQTNSHLMLLERVLFYGPCPIFLPDRLLLNYSPYPLF